MRKKKCFAIAKKTEITEIPCASRVFTRNGEGEGPNKFLESEWNASHCAEFEKRKNAKDARVVTR